MSRLFGGLALSCSLCLAVMACSSDDGDDPNPSTGGSVTAAGAAGAGSSQGGASGKGGASTAGSSMTSAGAAGTAEGGAMSGAAGNSSAGTGGAPALVECSPGELARLDDEKSLIEPCDNYDPEDISQDAGTALTVYSVALDTDPVDESTIALSVHFTSGQHPKMELWTSNEKCGQGAQQVKVMQAGPGGACMQREALSARPYLLLALFEDEPVDHVTVCARGTCP